MRCGGVRVGVLALAVWALPALWVGSAAAEPGSGPRQTIDQTFTAKRASSPTGVGYTGRYHAAGNPDADPPFMRRMVFFPPRGFRFDTSVPERCGASDLELSMNGPAACPEGSRLGGGTTEGVFMAPLAHSVVIDRYTHTLDVMNNTDEQIILVESEGFTVVRGRFRPDGSVEFNSPTCFPPPPSGACADDYVLQLGSSTFLPRYTKTSAGRVRSYATTPPKCPARGFWRSKVRFWWADGSVDTVATDQPCKRPRNRR
jgi:hypothetical protein